MNAQCCRKQMVYHFLEVREKCFFFFSLPKCSLTNIRAHKILQWNVEIHVKLSVRSRTWFNTNMLVICWSFCVDYQARRSVWNQAETGNTCWSSLLLLRNEMKQNIAYLFFPFLFSFFCSRITLKAYWLAWTMELQEGFMSSGFHVPIYERKAINTLFQVLCYCMGWNFFIFFIHSAYYSALGSETL